MINLKKSIHFLFCLCLSETLDLRNTNLLEIYFCTLFEKKKMAEMMNNYSKPFHVESKALQNLTL